MRSCHQDLVLMNKRKWDDDENMLTIKLPQTIGHWQNPCH